MIITIHKIEVKDGREHITFTSDRNEAGLTRPFQKSFSHNDRLKKILSFLESSVFEPKEAEIGKFNTKDIIEEPKEEPKEVIETTEEKAQREYRDEKNSIDSQIRSLLEGIKEDKELIELNETFAYTSTKMTNIIKDKKNKFVKYEELKARLEELKTLVVEEV